MKQEHLKDAALCAIKFVEKYRGKDAKTKRYQALNALAELTLADLESGKEEQECEYRALKLLEKIKVNYADDESKKRNVNRFLKELTQHLPSHEEMLKDLAKENNLSAIPSFDFEASRGLGSGNYTKHFIQPIILDEIELSETSIPTPDGAIKYYLETVENLPWWIRWLNNFELTDQRIKFIAGLMILALIVSLVLYALFVMVFLNNQSSGLQIFKSFMGTSALILAILWPFRLLYLCVTKRIIVAPILMQSSDGSNAQIECVNTDKIRESTGKPVRKLRIVSYASTCPLCKSESRIEVESGGKEFHNRLIGRCLESPVEHVFSFDRSLKIGWPLRKP